MPVTLTIKQVPEELAERLRQRAADNRRSLQRELLLIMEHAAEDAAPVRTGEPAPPVYHVHPAAGKTAHHARGGKPAAGRLSLEVLWQRARELGAAMPAESADLIRRDRDTRGILPGQSRE